MDRVILHCDCNNFYASVECIHHPEYRSVPMAVCGDPKSRHGIILAKNELAKSYGVKTAETIWQAQQKCPNLTLVPPHHDDYHRYSIKINALYQKYTDRVEPFGIDESWLDVTGSRLLFGSGREIADRIRREIRENFGLSVSVGVSFNKIFAKLGSDYKKPDATTVIDQTNWKKMLYPLPVTDLLFVGKSTASVLETLAVRTIGDLAGLNRNFLIKKLGKSGEQLWLYANGLDQSPVARYEDVLASIPKSIGNGTTYAHNLKGMAELKPAVLSLCDEVSARMRRHGVKCHTLQLQIKSPDFKVIQRQKPLLRPTSAPKELCETACAILKECWDETAPVRMLTVTGTNLTTQDVGEQLSFLSEYDEERHEKLERLGSALDSDRGKYGQNAVSFGSLLSPKDSALNQTEQ